MKPSIAKVFQKLQSDQETVQSRAISELALVLQHARCKPQGDERLLAEVFNEDAQNLTLSPRDIAEILQEAARQLYSKHLHRNSKISLFWLVAQMDDLEHADELMKCFSDFAPSFSEQEAFSSIAQITSLCMRANQEPSRLQLLLSKHNTLRLIESLQLGPSPRVRESAAALAVFLRERNYS